MEHRQMMRKYDFVLYIGRFQPVHSGHLETITKAFYQTKNVIVVIGSANQAPTPKNPWPVYQREEMINSLLNIIHPDVGSKLHFIPMEDRLYNDDKWLAYLQAKIEALVGKGSMAIIGHDKGDSGYIKQCFPDVDFLDTGAYIKEEGTAGKVVSATKIRQLMFEGDVGYTASNLPAPVYRKLEAYVKTPEFDLLQGEYSHILAEEEIVKNLPYGMTFLTADSVVVQSGHILLVKRAEYPGKGLWALPGVHIGLNETVDEASIRALRDETNLRVPVKALKGSLEEVKRFDHPERSLRARLTQQNARSITEAFFYRLDSNTPLPKNVKAGKGIEKAWWFSLAEAKQMRPVLFEDHADIIDYFIG
jgi:bifunctional NMN adenylyltransferase/nudix hydrolase